MSKNVVLEPKSCTRSLEGKNHSYGCYEKNKILSVFWLKKSKILGVHFVKWDKLVKLSFLIKWLFSGKILKMLFGTIIFFWYLASMEEIREVYREFQLWQIWFKHMGFISGNWARCRSRRLLQIPSSTDSSKWSHYYLYHQPLYEIICHSNYCCRIPSQLGTTFLAFLRFLNRIRSQFSTTRYSICKFLILIHFIVVFVLIV